MSAPLLTGAQRTILYAFFVAIHILMTTSTLAAKDNRVNSFSLLGGVPIGLEEADKSTDRDNNKSLSTRKTSPPNTGAEQKLIIPRIIPIDGQGVEGAGDEAEWLSTIVLQDPFTRCTATAIGPRVVLTAAHCIVGRSELTINIPGRNIPIELDCIPHPRYRPYGRGLYFDYALCLLSSSFPIRRTLYRRVNLTELNEVLDGELKTRLPGVVELYRTQIIPEIADKNHILPSLDLLKDRLPRIKGLPPYSIAYKTVRIVLDLRQKITRNVDVRFERLSLRPDDGRYRFRDRHARRVLLAGYGCTNREETGGNDNNLRFGPGRISKFGRSWLTIGARRAVDSAILCKGDSGGATYRLLDDKHNGRRRIIAVNAFNLVPAGRVFNRSFVTKTTSRAFRRFYRRWWLHSGRPIVCGVNAQQMRYCHD